MDLIYCCFSPLFVKSTCTETYLRIAKYKITSFEGEVE